MNNKTPEPHSPLKAMILKVALWGGIPLALIGLVVLMSALQPTAQSEANRTAEKWSKMYNSRKAP